MKGLVLVLLLAGCARPTPAPFDFECVTDGETVTTHHTGLTYAGRASNGDWALTYVEGGERWYRPRPGEACGKVSP